MILWLDDLREPWQHGRIGAAWVKTADAAIRLLGGGKVTFASLDHDLSVDATMGLPVADEETGYSVVCWLEAHPEYWPKDGVKVHSMNPVGKARMLVPIRAHYGRDFQRVDL